MNIQNLIDFLDKHEWHTLVWDHCDKHFIDDKLCYCKRCQSYVLIMLEDYRRPRLSELKHTSFEEKSATRISVTYNVAVEGGSDFSRLEIFNVSQLIER
jgi:hypothetical protein